MHADPLPVDDPDDADSAHGHSEAVTPDETTDSAALSAVPTLPFHGTRGTAPGPGGCWALTSTRHQPCRAAAIRETDYCSAHSGRGVAADPRAFAPKGLAASAASRRAKAELRLALGITRPNSPRAVLKGLVGLNAERLAGRAVAAALDPEADPLKAGQHALALIREADPQATATAVLSTDFNPSTASIKDLMVFAEANGIDWQTPQDGSVEPSSGT